MVAERKRGKLRIVSEKIGLLPVLCRYVERLHLDCMLSGHIPARRLIISHVQCILLLVRNKVIDGERRDDVFKAQFSDKQKLFLSLMGVSPSSYEIGG